MSSSIFSVSSSSTEEFVIQDEQVDVGIVRDLLKMIDQAAVMFEMAGDHALVSPTNNVQSLAQIYESHGAGAPSLWVRFQDCINSHPVAFLVCTAAELTIGAGLLVSALWLPLLGIIGIATAAIAIGAFSLQLFAYISHCRRKTAILNDLQDLKFAGVISVDDYGHIRTALADPDRLRTVSIAWLQRLQRKERFSEDQFQQLISLVASGDVQMAYEAIVLSCLTKNTHAIFTQLHAGSSSWQAYFKRSMDAVYLYHIQQHIGKNLEGLTEAEVKEEVLNALRLSPQNERIRFLVTEIQSYQDALLQRIAKRFNGLNFYDNIHRNLNALHKCLERTIELSGDYSSADKAAFQPIRDRLHASFVHFGEFLTLHLPDDFFRAEDCQSMALNFLNQWVRINDVYEAVEQMWGQHRESVHLTCRCDFSPLNTSWPLHPNRGVQSLPNPNTPVELEDSPLFPAEGRLRPKVLVFTSKAGGGNQMVSLAVSAAIHSGYHVSIAASLNPTQECIWNKMAEMGCWKLMRCLMGCRSNDYETALRRSEDRVVLELQRERPKLIINCAPNVTIACQKLAAERHIPLLAVATDFEARDFVMGMTTPCDNLVIAIPHEDQAIQAPLLPIVGASNIEVTGYPINQVFYLRTPEQVQALRVKYGIPDNGRVLLLMMGSLGCGNALETYTQQLIDSEKSLVDSDQELHLVVFCGKNESLFTKLSQRFASGNLNSNIVVRPLPMVPQQTVAEYFAIAEGLITKPGGASVAEALTMGVPLLLDDTQGQAQTLYWEQSNIDFATNYGGAAVLRNEADLVAQVQGILQREPASRTSVVFEPFKERIVQIINNLIQEKTRA